MSELLNQEKKELHLTAECDHCPYCSTNDIDNSEIDIKGNKIHAFCSCNQCQEEWTDEYTMTDVY